MKIFRWPEWVCGYLTGMFLAAVLMVTDSPLWPLVALLPAMFVSRIAVLAINALDVLTKDERSRLR